jgi:hypothetical protein
MLPRDSDVDDMPNTKGLPGRDLYRISRFRLGAYPFPHDEFTPFRHNREEMRMSPNIKHNRSIIVISAVVALITAASLATEASAMWIPDLVFPENASVPIAKPDRTVTGFTLRGSRALGARQTTRGTVPKAARKENPRAPVSNAKEAKR